MTEEKALEILIQLMIENADVLKRLKEGEGYTRDSPPTTN